MIMQYIPAQLMCVAALSDSSQICSRKQVKEESVVFFSPPSLLSSLTRREWDQREKQ